VLEAVESHGLERHRVGLAQQGELAGDFADFVADEGEPVADEARGRMGFWS
jgi:hypothetical protein